MNRKVAIFELNPRGHRLAYVARLLDYASDKGYQAFLFTTRKVVESPEWDVHIRSGDTSREPVTVMVQNLAGALSESEGIGVSTLVLPDGDHYILELIRQRLPKGLEITVLCMRMTGQPKRSVLLSHVRTILKGSARAVLRRRRSVRVLGLVGATQQARPLKTVSDPVTLRTTTAAMAMWNFEENRYWFGIVGAIDARKNPELVMKAVAQFPAGLVGIAILGRQSPAVREAINRCRKTLDSPCVIDDRTLSEEEFDSAVARLDCVVLAHSNEGPSGVLGKAALAGTSVVAAGAKSLREQINDSSTRIGAWSKLNVADLHLTMLRVMEMEPEAASMPPGARVDSFGAALFEHMGPGSEQ